MEGNAVEETSDADKYLARFGQYETLFQDDTGEIREPVGQACDRLLCFQVKDVEDHSPQPCLFWLSVLEGNYYRFFLDTGAYIVQWFREDAALFEEELREEGLTKEQYPTLLDLSQLHGLQGQKIVSITVERVMKNRLYILRFTMLLSEGHFLRLKYTGEETLMEVA